MQSNEFEARCQVSKRHSLTGRRISVLIFAVLWSAGACTLDDTGLTEGTDEEPFTEPVNTTDNDATRTKLAPTPLGDASVKPDAARQPDASDTHNRDASFATDAQPKDAATVVIKVAPPLAYEGFDGAPGPLHQSTGGFGWADPWDVQNGDRTLPGCEIGGGGSLFVPGLAFSGLSTLGGCAFLTAVRRLDATTSGRFAMHRNTSSGLIGAEGETLWFSFVVKKELNDDAPVFVQLAKSAVYSGPWPDGFAVGFTGESSKRDGHRVWGVHIAQELRNSSRRVELGVNTLLVTSIRFANRPLVRMFVDPKVGASPNSLKPDVEVDNVAADLSFQWLSLHLADHAKGAAADELRIGTSYEVVTPKAAAP